MKFRQNWVVFIATGAYIGYIPKAPGTFGSIWGVLLAFWISRLPGLTAAICLAGLFFLAIWASGYTQKIIARKDPGCIVIDEVVGVVVGFIGLPFNLYTVIAGFVLFRIFDIFKPFPVNWIDKHVSGGLGVVLDDVAAGMYAHLMLRAGVMLIS